MNHSMPAISAYAHGGTGPSLSFCRGAVPKPICCCAAGAVLSWSLLSEALSYTDPEMFHLTLMVIVAAPPAARDPSTQRTVEADRVQPAEADTKTAPAGRVSVTTVLVAANGPLFVAVML
jgi:hypothetical protein